VNGGGSLFQSAQNPPQWIQSPQTGASQFFTFTPPIANRPCEVLTLAVDLRALGTTSPLGFYVSLCPLTPTPGPPGPWVFPILDAFTDAAVHAAIDTFAVLRPDRPYWIPPGQQIIAGTNGASVTEFVSGPWIEYVQPLTQ
jgi:hypothetical protein